ncbi:transposable element Tcb1 transposase [Trichonephila clavipes]|nr:transposable element Tcb1 transposase [Trichonephila clavipes]
MQVETTDRRCRSHSLPVMTADCAHGSDGSRSHITSHSTIDSVCKHHSESALTIRCRLQLSGMAAKRPLLRLPSTGNHRPLHHKWCDKRRTVTTEWNDNACIATACNGRIRVRRYRSERLMNC